jgi:copper transporter 1
VLQDEEYALPEETEEKLLPNGSEEKNLMRRLKGRTAAVVLEQLLRGLIHTVQFSVSYCIMLLFMYSNGKYLSSFSSSSLKKTISEERIHWYSAGYIIISILIGSLVGFALFTRDTLNYRRNQMWARLSSDI